VSYPFSDGETTTLAAAGQPGIEVHATALMANPYVLGWEYQSFGIWNTNGSATSGVRASSFGAPTPASAVPTVGFAAFSGKLAGIYFSSAGEPSAAAADLSVNANFSKRALNLSSTGTTIARDARSAIAAPHLNLSGTLSYAPGSSSFAGTLANSGGTMSGASKGQFYGPTAQELGGVFTLKSPTTAETFTGAFGGKR
jgi:phage baseplate assembly protein gpV